MIISFSIKNYKSFHEEQTFSMVAHTKFQDHRKHLIEIPNHTEKITPIAAIYGANGAGKSTLVNAISILEQIVTKSSSSDSLPYFPFKLSHESTRKPTMFSMQFISEKTTYLYGIEYDQEKIGKEWLSIILPNAKEEMLFERTTNEWNKVDIFPGDKSLVPDRVQNLAKAGVTPPQSFLQVIGKNIVAEDQGLHFKQVLDWFTKKLTIIYPKTQYYGIKRLIENKPAFKDFAGNFLREMDQGFGSFRVKTIVRDYNELKDSGDISYDDLVEKVPMNARKVFRGDKESDITIDRGEITKITLSRLQSTRKTIDGEEVDFALADESDGTRRVMDLLPALYFSKDKVYIVDEIDRSLHPLLAKRFVKKFLNQPEGMHGQFIFTTHETGLLDLSLLRRDEIWFVEKKPETLSSEIYSLSEFKERNDSRIDKGYLQGRFGAVPPIELEMPEWVEEIKKEMQPSPQNPQ